MEEMFEKILKYVVQYHITDIHFEIRDVGIQVEGRFPSNMKLLPQIFAERELIEYLKYLANIDLSKPFFPQSGSFRYVYSGFEYFFRLACIKTTFNESIVLRVLNKFNFLENISILQIQNDLLMQTIKKDSGLILISGPTGSGKTTTMYNLLSKLKGKKIYTIEDPIEIYFDSLVQLQINKQRNLTYDEGLKQILRHDPDVIVIGEIRGKEEAQMAVRCSLTGHLVIATIHSKSIFTIMPRMLDLEVNNHDLIDSLILITNQRLLTLKHSKKRVVLYEMMEERKIATYTTQREIPKTFLTIDKQLELFAKYF